MTTVQIRIDEKTKRDAKRVFDRIGIDMSGAVKLFLRQVSIQKEIPMQLLTENGLTLEEEFEILKSESDAKAGKNVSRTLNSKDAIAYLKSIL